MSEVGSDDLALMAAIDSAAGLDAALTRIGAHFDAVSGTIHVLRPDRMLELAAAFGIPPAMRSVISLIPIGKGIAGVAAQRREPVTICNLQSDESGVARPAARMTGVEGAIAVPILDGGHVLGVLGIGKAQPHTYTDDESALLLGLARRLIPFLRPAE